MGNIFKRIFGGKTSDIEERNIAQTSLAYLPTNSLGLPYGTYGTSPISAQAAMQLSAVYRAVDVISDSVASQSWIIKEWDDIKGFTHNPFHSANQMLNLAPNYGMSTFSFMKTLVSKMLLEGNSFARIIRDLRGDPVSLHLVNGGVKMYLMDDGQVYYETGTGKNLMITHGEDMIHILNYTYDGYLGVSTLTHAAGAMGLSQNAEQTASGYFSAGMNAGGILTVEGKLSPDKAENIKAAWAAAFNSTTGVPGGIAVMEKGLEFKQLTINPQDSQLLETRKFNVTEIARFFGVHPSKLFDDGAQTYSNVEAHQLGYLTDTISPLDSKIENEFNRKLFRPSVREKTKLSLSIEELQRANMDTKANYLSKMFQSGGYTVNEIRTQLGLPEYPGENSNQPLVQVNMSPINKLGVKPNGTTSTPKPPPTVEVETIKEEDNGEGN